MKAELLNKQNQAKQALPDGTRAIKRLKTQPKTVVQNKGVLKRAQQDELNREDENEPSLEKVNYIINIFRPDINDHTKLVLQSKLMLQEKAKLYEKLSKDKDILEEDTISEEQSYFLVNFQQKVIENTMSERRIEKSNFEFEDGTPKADEKDYEASDSDEEW